MPPRNTLPTPKRLPLALDGREGRFTPCAAADSLLEAVHEVVSNTTSGDAVVLSPARSSHDQSRNHRGEFFTHAVNSRYRGALEGDPNIDGTGNVIAIDRNKPDVTEILLRVFLRKKPGAKTVTNQSLKK